MLNIAFAIVIVGILYRYRGEVRSFRASIVGLIAVFIRTVLDYYLEWYFYFPAH